MMVLVDTGTSNLIPSMAEVTLIAGVINPSAISVAQPIIAAYITHLAL
jgi:hypothetical protein